MPMIWKTPDGNYLVQRDMHLIPMATTIRLPNGETISLATVYYLCSVTGKLNRKYPNGEIAATDLPICADFCE
jgi:hypothetical protein